MGQLLLERLALADVAAVQHDAAHVLVVQQVGVQHLVPGRVAEAVVDGLEIVQVDEHDRDLGNTPRGAHQGVLDTV